jgi:nitric oxide reductase subunit B
MSGAIPDPASVVSASTAPETATPREVELAVPAGRTRPFATLTFMRGSLIAMAVTLVAGLLGALYSVPTLAPAMQSLGLDLRQLRPIHTTFAGAWIFLGGAMAVHRFLQDKGGPATRGDSWRLRIQVLCWAIAGLGILVTLLFRITSGREYVGFHPSFAVLIVTGWLCYVWNFYRVVWQSFWKQPIYVTMWGVALLFFLYTFIEQHAYLIPSIFSDPVHDLRVQWKATGTLVGSFNLFVYGTLIYVGELISGDPRYGHSKTAYALFGVGLLNSFTNFGHHTYHLPQSALVNWISFVVSMTEIIILARAVRELWCLVRSREDHPFPAACTTFAAAKWWTVAILFTSLLISVPPLNAVIHGTYVVTGHAMGATIGIDTMILLGALFFILGESGRNRDPGAAARLNTVGMQRMIVGLNVSVAALVAWLHVSGVTTAVTRMAHAPGETYVSPTWLAASNGVLFSVTGGAAIVFFGTILYTLIPVSFSRGSSRLSTAT